MVSKNPLVRFILSYFLKPFWFPLGQLKVTLEAGFAAQLIEYILGMSKTLHSILGTSEHGGSLKRVKSSRSWANGSSKTAWARNTISKTIKSLFKSKANLKGNE